MTSLVKIRGVLPTKMKQIFIQHFVVPQPILTSGGNYFKIDQHSQTHKIVSKQWRFFNQKQGIEYLVELSSLFYNKIN